MRRSVLEISREAARSLAFQPRVVFDGPVDVEITGTLADDLLAALREALSNVARHADAHSVEIEVSAGAAAIALRVTDDGIGLPEEVNSGGRGLANMHARAERHQGHCTLERGPNDTGTVVDWWVPNPSP